MGAALAAPPQPTPPPPSSPLSPHPAVWCSHIAAVAEIQCQVMIVVGVEAAAKEPMANYQLANGLAAMVPPTNQRPP